MLKTLRNYGFWLLVGLVGACSPTDQSCSGPLESCADAGPGQICKLGDGTGQCLPARDGGDGLRCYPREEPNPAP